MILATEIKLFELLDTLPVYQESFSLDTYNGYTPDSSMTVVRYGASEYLQLLDAPQITRPFCAVQRMNRPEISTTRPLATGARIWDHLDVPTNENAIQAPYPRPVDLEWQLDIRSPHDTWLTQIEVEIDRYFGPVYDTVIDAAPLGSTIGAISFPVRFVFQGAGRMSDRQDEVKSRYFRTVYRVQGQTRLMPASSQQYEGKTCKLIRTQIENLDGDVLDVVDLTEE